MTLNATRGRPGHMVNRLAVAQGQPCAAIVITSPNSGRSVGIEDYARDGLNVRAILLSGDTRPLKDDLRTRFGGRWNRTLNAWTFSKTRETDILDFLASHL